MGIKVPEWRWCHRPAPQIPVCPMWELEGAPGGAGLKGQGLP